MRRIANRKHEFNLFERMLHSDSAHRVLLIEGTSERGKSVLLAEFAALATEKIGPGRCICADLKGQLQLADLFSRFHAEVGKEVFATYANQCGLTPLQVNVSADLSSAKFEDNNHITVQPIIHASALESKQQIRDAIIHDLNACKKPLVLILDTFEDATQEASQWIIQHLLPSLRHNIHLRIVIAGQRVPNHRDFPLTWGRLAKHQILLPITSVDDWYDFARLRHPGFPREDIETVCRGGLTDWPNVINSFIENIVRGLPPDEKTDIAS